MRGVPRRDFHKHSSDYSGGANQGNKRDHTYPVRHNQRWRPPSLCPRVHRCSRAMAALTPLICSVGMSAQWLFQCSSLAESPRAATLFYRFRILVMGCRPPVRTMQHVGRLPRGSGDTSTLVQLVSWRGNAIRVRGCSAFHTSTDVCKGSPARADTHLGRRTADTSFAFWLVSLPCKRAASLIFCDPRLEKIL